ncbi:MAG: hypothetical protein ACE141_19010 [Bryobacteraceae bacterium]
MQPQVQTGQPGTSMQGAAQTQSASSGVPASPGWLKSWEDLATPASATANVIALGVAAVWAYMLFVRRRQKFPRANVEHRIAHWATGGGAFIVHVVVRITNVGEAVIRLKSMLVRIQQLLPTPPEVADAIAKDRDPVSDQESEISWPLIVERKCDWQKVRQEVEPGETEECHFDFVIPPELQKIEVYSYVGNIRKRRREIGWNTTTMYSLTPGGHHAEDQGRRTGPAEEAATAAQAEAWPGKGQMTNICVMNREERQGPPKVPPPPPPPKK